MGPRVPRCLPVTRVSSYSLLTNYIKYKFTLLCLIPYSVPSPTELLSECRSDGNYLQILHVMHHNDVVDVPVVRAEHVHVRNTPSGAV